MNINHSSDKASLCFGQAQNEIKAILLPDLFSSDSLEFNRAIHGDNPVSSKNVLRIKQWEALRHLLFIAGISSPLKYLPNGKPVLDENLHISVSHSGQSMMLSYGGVNHGTDIERSGMKAHSVRSRFCNAAELLWAEKLKEPDIFTSMWSVKEAIFKYFGETVDFRAHISIEPFMIDSEEIYASYSGGHGQVDFRCGHWRLHDLHVVMAMPSKPF